VNHLRQLSLKAAHQLGGRGFSVFVALDEDVPIRGQTGSVGRQINH
jgi:hypothetical protein